MRRILAVLWADDDADTVVPAALAVGKRFGSEIVGLSIRPPAGEFVPTGDFGMALSQDYLDRMHRDAVDRSARLRRAFQERVAAADIRLGDPAANEASAGWLELEGSAALVLGNYGRVFDLVVVRRPETKRAAETEILLEAALFETGRPVLVVPSTPAPDGDTVMIAWNGSTETARTIALGLPLLQRAERVVVVSVEGSMSSGPPGTEVARYLAAHGIIAQARHVDPGTTSAGETFLREAGRVNASLMFKGAYTQSRLRQLIFGGATRHILSNAGLPVLFAH